MTRTDLPLQPHLRITHISDSPGPKNEPPLDTFCARPSGSHFHRIAADSRNAPAPGKLRLIPSICPKIGPQIDTSRSLTFCPLRIPGPARRPLKPPKKFKPDPSISQLRSPISGQPFRGPDFAFPFDVFANHRARFFAKIAAPFFGPPNRAALRRASHPHHSHFRIAHLRHIWRPHRATFGRFFFSRPVRATHVVCCQFIAQSATQIAPTWVRIPADSHPMLALTKFGTTPCILFRGTEQKVPPHSSSHSTPLAALNPPEILRQKRRSIRSKIRRPTLSVRCLAVDSLV